MSAGEAEYFIMLMNSISTFRYIDSLKKKMVKTILKVLKIYMAEAERLIEQRLISIQVDKDCE